MRYWKCGSWLGTGLPSRKVSSRAKTIRSRTMIHPTCSRKFHQVSNFAVSSSAYSNGWRNRAHFFALINNYNNSTCSNRKQPNCIVAHSKLQIKNQSNLKYMQPLLRYWARLWTLWLLLAWIRKLWMTMNVQIMWSIC